MTTTVTPTVDVDNLPPTQYLILEVLAARHRTGEQLWTFPQRLHPQLRALERAGLVVCMHGIAERTLRAYLTEPGKAAALAGDYHPPCDRKAAADALRWAADRADPGDVARLRLWAEQVLRGAINI